MLGRGKNDFIFGYTALGGLMMVWGVISQAEIWVSKKITSMHSPT